MRRRALRGRNRQGREDGEFKSVQNSNTGATPVELIHFPFTLPPCLADFELSLNERIPLLTPCLLLVDLELLKP